MWDVAYNKDYSIIMINDKRPDNDRKKNPVVPADGKVIVFINGGYSIYPSEEKVDWQGTTDLTTSILINIDEVKSLISSNAVFRKVLLINILNS